MGSQKREIERRESINDAAEHAATEAGAIKRCDDHDEIILSIGDEENEKRAYAIAVQMWKNGEVNGTKKELLEAVKDIIDSSSDDCSHDDCQ